MIEATQERWTEADMYRVRGELLNTIGDPARLRKASIKPSRLRAAECEALGVARRQLCAPLATQGKRAEARDLLAPIYGWFTEGFDTPVLQEANGLLENLALT